MELRAIAKKRMLWVSVTAIVLLAAAVLLAVAGPAADPTAVPEPLDARGVPGGVPGLDGSDADTSSDPLATVPGTEGDPMISGAAGGSASGGSAASGGSSAPPDSSGGDVSAPGDGDAARDDPATPVRMATLRVLWWNDTEDVSPEGTTISVGSSSWRPDPTVSSATGALSNVPVGVDVVLVVHPDGPGGSRIEVPLFIRADMAPAADRDSVTVELSDARVRVLGTPVDNVDVTFDRF